MGDRVGDELVPKLVSQAEDEREGVIDRAQLASFEAPGGWAEPLRVDNARLLDEDARLTPVEDDRGAEARRQGGGGGWRDERCAEVEELVGLHDDGVALTALLVPARAAA
jgi:hypothetical protein